MNTTATPLPPKLEEFLEDLYVREQERHQPPTMPANGDDEPLRQAVELGLLVLAADGLPHLTETGRVAGRDVVRRHRLAECLLCDVLNVRPEELHADACQMEHIIQHGLDEKICVLLGHPRACPHGKPIPEGACCARADQAAIREVKPLCDGQVEADGVVAYLSARENREIQKLMAMGILPGTPIRLLRRFPSYVFQVGYSQFTVDRDLAEKIVVHWK